MRYLRVVRHDLQTLYAAFAPGPVAGISLVTVKEIRENAEDHWVWRKLRVLPIAESPLPMPHYRRAQGLTS